MTNQAPKITLDYWRVLVAVVEEGGYAQAAQALNKTQSSMTYAIQRIEDLLGVKVFTRVGRKAQLTEVGRMLYRRGKTLLDQANRPRLRGRNSAGGGCAISDLATA